jgi:hypothetical protein
MAALRKEGFCLNAISQVIDAQRYGKFIVLTRDGAKGFQELDQCEEYINGLGGARFVVLRLLGMGGMPDQQEEGADSRREIEWRQQERDNLIRQAILEGHHAKHQLTGERRPSALGPVPQDQQKPESPKGE